MAEYVTSCFGMAPEGSEVLASRWSGFGTWGLRFQDSGFLGIFSS